MGAELANNVLWTAVGGVAMAIIAYVRSGRDKQEERIDRLFGELGAANAKLELMSAKVGSLEGKVENLEHHRDELIAENKLLKTTIDTQALQLVLKDNKIGELTGTNTELYDDLNKVQGELTKVQGELQKVEDELDQLRKSIAANTSTNGADTP